jgi:quercetin dioxygenase-like cupin family protein
MDIRNHYFTTEEEAVAEIKAAGFWPVTFEFQPAKKENHWHDFDSMVFVLDGEISLTEAETGETCICGPGTRVIAKAGVVHREEHGEYKAVIGFSVNPATLTQPIDKPPREA